MSVIPVLPSMYTTTGATTATITGGGGGDASSVPPPPAVAAPAQQYCYLDVDLQQHRDRFATVTAFVQATNHRYHFSSPDVLLLGGSELSRIMELLPTDHEWSSASLSSVSSSSNSSNRDHIVVRPPVYGNRLIVRLDWNAAPLACENFATLCHHGSSSVSLLRNGGGGGGGKKTSSSTIPMGECGKPLTYRNSTIHRIVPQFILQGGDFVFGNGSGGESIYNGKKFKDERNGLLKKHNRRGILSMGNSGKNSNSSQFFITFAAAPQCDGKHVVFGEVISGWEVLDAIEAMGSRSGDPTGPVVITDCGIWQPFVTPPSGYWYDPPSDPDASPYPGLSSMFIVRPRVAVIGPNMAVLEKFNKVLSHKCTSVKLLSVEASADDDKIIQTVHDLLLSWSIDVVLVAPACRDMIARIELPWNMVNIITTTTSIGKQDVILECKALDAVTMVYKKSWLQYQTNIWKMDYCHQ
jgi:peptidylprolyl isomerase